jgi:hypothetical protein
MIEELPLIILLIAVIMVVAGYFMEQRSKFGRGD